MKPVPGDQNVTDDATKGISVKDLNGRWMNGPQFLYMPEEDLPKAIAVADMKPKLVKNVIKYKQYFSYRILQLCCSKLLIVKGSQNWRRLIRVTAQMISFVDNLKQRSLLGDLKVKANAKNKNDCLTPDELQEAELLWIKDSQKEIQGRALNGEFKMLSPFKDENGIIRVIGRVDKALATYDAKHPHLITSHMNQFGDCGIAATAAKTKQNLCILCVLDLAKKIKF